LFNIQSKSADSEIQCVIVGTSVVVQFIEGSFWYGSTRRGLFNKNTCKQLTAFSFTAPLWYSLHFGGLQLYAAKKVIYFLLSLLLVYYCGYTNQEKNTY